MIEQAALEAQVPPEFVRAIAREESSFNPTVVSTALAYGLIQLIRPTARIYAQPLGLPSDPDSLKRPEINLRIGSAFIKELWHRYPHNTAVVPAAYNAGYTAADRWLNANPGVALDEWVERIPYRETRRYTRRVLQTYGIYSWLDTGKLPPLPPLLPSPPLIVPAEPPPQPEAETETTSTAGVH
jgi:soluble lytic murein transglycosylase